MQEKAKIKMKQKIRILFKTRYAMATKQMNSSKNDKTKKIGGMMQMT